MKQIFFIFSRSLAIGVMLVYFSPAMSQDTESAFSRPAMSQDTERVGPQIGIMGAFNNNQLDSPGTTQGFMGGVYIDYSFSFLNARLGIAYDQLGGARPDLQGLQPLPDGNNTIMYTYTDREVRLHNASAPLVINIYYPGSQGGTINPRLSLGFSYSYTFSAIEERDIMFEFPDGTYAKYSGAQEDVLSDYEEHNLAYMAGFGFDFNLDDGRRAYLEVMYKQGINEINKVDLGRRGNLGDIYTNTISIGFGVSLFKL